MLTDSRDEPFAGIGVIHLLKAIRRHHSINSAAKACGISYVKAWRMMNRLDDRLGQPVLKRTSGGKQGGGAVLTTYGARFLRHFEAFYTRIERTAKVELHRFVQRLSHILLCVVLALSSCARKDAAVKEDPARVDLRVAAAADLKFALDEIARRFQEHHPEWTVQIAYGSSGNFFSQLVNEAPFDMFFSADLRHPNMLVERGLADEASLFHYAAGRIVIWALRDSPIDVEPLGMASLLHPAAVKVAIANPRHAPYGEAAAAALRSYGIYERVEPKLVFGENIAQTAQMIESGAAPIGIVALALAQAPVMSGKGKFWEIPLDRYPRMDQGGAIMIGARNPDAARALRAFVLGEEGRAVLSDYGFLLPEGR